MQITDILNQMGGLRSMAQELGVSEAEAARGADALLPAILGGLQKQGQMQAASGQAALGGAGGLAGMLQQLGGSSLFDDVLSAQPTPVNRGNDVLGQIFGSKDVSRTVAQSAAGQSGLDPSLLKKMLPLLAMLATGFLARQTSASNAAPSAPAQGGGGLGDILGGMLGGGSAGGSLGGNAGGGLGGLGALLDQNGDGNALDDILRMAGKMMR